MSQLPTLTTRRSALHLGACAVIMGAISFGAIAMTEPSDETDPIFSAIAAHRAAWQAGETGPFDTDEDNEEYFAGEWSDIEEQTFAALIATTPTTLAGIIALATYIAENERRAIYDDRPHLLAGCIARVAVEAVAS